MDGKYVQQNVEIAIFRILMLKNRNDFFVTIIQLIENYFFTILDILSQVNG